ncbi:MAG: hypothetical protein GXP22_00255 [Gammaproteobacteria bacterium]|nr:hypothetical protein [Gammaproteobacteria bacterium]
MADNELYTDISDVTLKFSGEVSDNCLPHPGQLMQLAEQKLAKKRIKTDTESLNVIHFQLSGRSVASFDGKKLCAGILEIKFERYIVAVYPIKFQESLSIDSWKTNIIVNYNDFGQQLLQAEDSIIDALIQKIQQGRED